MKFSFGLVFATIWLLVENVGFAQRAIKSTFVERPNQPPKVFVLDLQQTDRYFLKPSKSFSWHLNPLNNLATINVKIIQEELDLTGDQVKQFRNMERRFLEYANERLKIALEKIAKDETIPGKEKLGPATRITNELQAILNQQSDEEIRDLLVPAQMQRLNELRHQVNQKRLGTAEYLLTPELIKKLGISKEQAKAIREADHQIDASNRKTLWELRSDIRESIFSGLSPSQKNTVQNAFGKEAKWYE